MHSILSLTRRGLLIILGFNLFLGVVISEGQAAYTKQNSRVVRFQAEVTTVAGNVTAVKCDAFLVSSFVNTTDATDIVDAPKWTAVNFDLLDPTLAGVNITAAGKTVSYQQLAALIRQASLDRATAQGITMLNAETQDRIVALLQRSRPPESPNIALSSASSGSRRKWPRRSISRPLPVSRTISLGAQIGCN